MAIKRMDNVGIVVEDLDETIEFFVELGLTLEGRATIEGEWAGRVTGLGDQQVDIAMMVTPDGHSRLEISHFIRPAIVEITAMPRSIRWAICASCLPWMTSTIRWKDSARAARSLLANASIISTSIGSATSVGRAGCSSGSPRNSAAELTNRRSSRSARRGADPR